MVCAGTLNDPPPASMPVIATPMIPRSTFPAIRRTSPIRCCRSSMGGIPRGTSVHQLSVPDPQGDGLPTSTAGSQPRSSNPACSQPHGYRAPCTESPARRPYKFEAAIHYPSNKDGKRYRKRPSISGPYSPPAPPYRRLAKQRRSGWKSAPPAHQLPYSKPTRPGYSLRVSNTPQYPPFQNSNAPGHPAPARCTLHDH